MCGLLLIFSLCLASPGEPGQDPGLTGVDPLQWFREARFGLFVHWGPVSLKGTEIGWSRGGERRGRGGRGSIPVEVYDNLYRSFNPVKFDAREWVAIAKAAGMKYLVFTTKHHDGFSMFDSKATEYKITRSPFKRDVVKELAEACHEGGLRLGFYYSQPDWHHPDYRTERHDRYIKYLHGHVNEIMTDYGKVDILWFDGLGGKPEDWKAPELFEKVRALQPGILINNRAGLPGDFDTPEQRIGAFQNQRAWESCITICHQWAWKPDDKLKSLEECIHTLVYCAGGDGNLLLNVGPMPTGEIEARQVERLKEMGRWLDRFGETIYGTRGGPFKPGPWGASTHKGNRIFVHILSGDPPWSPILRLPPIEKKVRTYRLLTGGDVACDQTPEGLVLTIPVEDRKVLDTIVELTLDGPAGNLPPLAISSGSLTASCKTKASNVFKNDVQLGPDKAVDDDPHTRWATDFGTTEAWLEVDLGSPKSIGAVRIDEAYEGRVKRFAVEYFDGGGWKPLLEGTTLGRDFVRSVQAVSASRLRLHILEATEGPTIWEFQVFPPQAD